VCFVTFRVGGHTRWRSKLPMNNFLRKSLAMGLRCVLVLLGCVHYQYARMRNTI
jgi:hypothetical protein